MAKPLLHTDASALTDAQTSNIEAEFFSLVEKGLYLQAWHVANSSPLAKNPTAKLQLGLGQVLHHLGQPRLSHAITLTLWRNQPNTPAFAYAAARYWLRKFGPMATWAFLENHEPSSSEIEHQAKWLALKAIICSELKDWEMAEQLLKQARQISTTEASTTQIIRADAYLMTRLGHFEAAYTYLKEQWQSHASAPMLVHLAQSLHRSCDSENAIELLKAHATDYESIRPWLLLATLSCDTGDWGSTQCALEKIHTLQRGKDKQTQEQILGITNQLELGISLESKALKHNIKTLPVPKIFQKDKACVPSSLWALAQFWKIDTSLEQLETLSFGGTTSQTIRDWFTQHGLPFAEFDLTWDAAKSLIDLNIPFALTTLSRSGTHMQIVYGYNALTKTLLLIDPELEISTEQTCVDRSEESIFPQAHCWVFTAPKAADSDVLSRLPEAQVYRGYALFEKALIDGNSLAQQEAVQQLQTQFPTARLTALAQYELKLGSGNEADILAHTQRLLTQYPEDTRLSALVIQCLKRLGRYNQAQQILEQALLEKNDVTLLHLYAEDFKDVLKPSPEQNRVLRKLIRQASHSPKTATLFAQRHHRQHQLEQALTYYRWAVTLDDTNEQNATEYFRVATQLNRADEALSLLQNRWKTYQALSAGPVISLYSAYRFLNKHEQGLLCLEQNLVIRPNDSELIAFYCAKLIESGHLIDFNTLFATNQHKLEPMTAQALKAMALKHEGNLIEACKHFEELHQKQPLNTFFTETFYGLKRALSLTEDVDQDLTQLCETFNHNFQVLNLAKQWHSQASERFRILQLMAQRFPDLLPIRLQAIDALLALNDIDTASKEIEALSQDFENQAPVLAIKAQHHWLSGNTDQARTLALAALEKDCADASSAQLLLASTPGIEAKLEVINQLFNLILQQQSAAAIGPWWQLARQWTTPQMLLDQCQIFIETLGKQPQAWLALSHQHQDMSALPEALTVIEKGLQVMPGASELALARADIQTQTGELEHAIETLEHLHRTNPEWLEPAKRLAMCLQQLNKHERASDILTHAIIHNPDDGTAQGLLADAQWQLGNYEQALETLCRAVRLNMDYPWAWDRLRHWGAHQNKEHLAADLARELVNERPSSSVTWRILAQLEDSVQKALIDFDQALRLSPFDTKTHLARTELLLLADDPQAALEHLDQIDWPGDIPEAIILQKIELLLAVENLEKVFAYLQTAIALYPRSIALHAKKFEFLKSQEQVPLEEMLDCAQHLAALSSNDAGILCECAETLLQQGNPAHWPLAAQWLERAFALEPTDSYIGLTWWDYLLSHGPLDCATAIEPIVERSSDPQWWLPRYIKRLCLSTEFDQALTAWQTLIDLTTDSIWPKEAAFSVLSNTPVWNQTRTSLECALIQEQGCPKLFDMWLNDTLNRTSSFEPIESLLARIPSGALWRGCTQHYLYRLSETHSLPSEKFFTHFRPVLQSHFELLIGMGKLLCSDGHLDACMHWYNSAGLERPGPAYAHHHFHEVLLELGHYERAYEQIVLAQQAPTDHCRDGILVWEMTHQFLAHDATPGAFTHFKELERIKYENLNNTEQYIFGLLYLIDHLQDAAPEQSLSNSLIILKKIAPLWQQTKAKPYVGALRARLADLLMGLAQNHEKFSQRVWLMIRIKKFLI